MESKLIEYIAQNLVDDASQVDVRRKETGGSIIVHLKVAPGDMGRVIGKNGRVANAMRTLMRIPVKSRKRVILEIE